MIQVLLTGALETFDGPLDLLLALVRRHQYPLDQLPIAEITGKYNTYLRQAVDADVELGGDFLETASWLVLLKSRTLLPPDPGAGPATEELPEQELRRVLLDHATLKRTTARLGERMELAGIASGHALSSSAPATEEKEGLESLPPTLYDALLSARRALEQARMRAQPLAPVTPEDELYPVTAELERVLADLSSLPAGQPASSEGWFAARSDPLARAALLLALLELARSRQVLLGQPHSFGPIYLKRLAG